MNSNNKSTLLREISTLCDDKSSVRARFAVATFPGHSPSIILEKLLMFFEYIQLVSPILIMLSFLNFSNDYELFQHTLFLARLTNPSYWMSFDKTGALENMILILVCCFTLLKQILFMYILYRCKKSLEVSGTLGILIKALIKFQTRITYFYVSAFYINAIQVVNWEDFRYAKNQSGAIKIILFILIGFELIIALIPKMHYHYMLPTKSFLSSKTNTLEITTLVQKILMQILLFSLDFNLKASSWIFTSVNLCIDLFRISYFFRKLPLYSFKALHFQGGLLMVIASLNLSSFVTLIVKSIDGNSGSLAFSLVIWVVLGLFGIVVSKTLLRKVFLRVICDPKLDSPSLLVHRIVAIKELKRLTEEHCEKNDKYDFYFLVSQTLNQYIGKILWVADEKNSSESLNINTKELRNIMFQNYLEKLRERFPKNQFIQIFLAEFYFKTRKVYSASIRICLHLRQSGDLKMRPNAELLLLRIQDQIQNKFKTDDSKFDLVTYISEQAFVAQLKLEMIKQANFQARICSEILKDSPNLGLIYADSQKAHSHRQNTRRRISHISTALSEFNIDSLMISAKYYLSVNHDVTEYLHYMKLYSQKLSKYQKTFHQEMLCQQNSFEEKTGFLFISGAKGQESKIIYATKAIGDILGGDSSQYPGAYFTQNSPPIFRPIYTLAWKEIPESPESTYLGKITRCLLYHANGYLVEIDYYIGIHPYATQGFHFIFLIRPVISNREFMLVHENGDIDSVSKGLMEKLGLEPNVRKTNVRALNEQFGRVNEAFNMMAFPGRNSDAPLSKEEAEEVYAKYSGNFGCDVLLNSLEKNGLSYSYNCKMQNLLIGTMLIKTMIFEENKRENRERTYGELSPSHMKAATPKEISNNTFQTEEERTDSEVNKIQSHQLTEREILMNSQTQRGEEQDQEEPTTHRQLISSRTRRNNLELKNSTGLAHFSDSTNERQDYDDLSQRHEKAKISERSKNSSKLTQQKKLSKAFQASLDTRYYTKTFWALVSIFYLTLFGLLFVRIVLMTAIDKDINSLVAKKNIFSNNGYRSYRLVETSGLARFTYQVYSGTLNMADYGSTFSLTLDYVFVNIQKIREVNKVVLQASNCLSGDAQLTMFEKNVKIYDTYFDESVQKYSIMDSFQATDRIVETALFLYYGFLEMSTSSEIATRAHFLFRNSVNDLILENTRLSQSMLASFDEQFEYVQNIQMGFSILFASFLVIFAGVFFVFIGKQYSCDVFYISSVCKLNHNKIQSLRIEFVNFQKSLQDNQMTGEKSPVKFPRDSESSHHVVQRESLKAPEKKDLRKNFFIYIFGILAILITLIILVIINKLQASEILHKIKGDQERLYFVTTIRTRMAIASTCIRELLATNNTALIENIPVLDKLEEVVEQIKTLRIKAENVFLTEDVLKENSKVETILLGDGCSLLPSDYSYYCMYIKSNGISSGLIYLMNQYEGLMRGKLAAYVQSNKTEGALIELQAKYDYLAAMVYVIALEEIDILITMTNDQFEENVQSDRERRANSMISVFLVIVMTGILGWMFILKKLAGSVSNFKNILRSFPAELVLSSFIIKTFLLKSSKGVFDQVKNDI